MKQVRDETLLSDVLTMRHLVEGWASGVTLDALCFTGLGQYLGYHFNNGLRRLGLNNLFYKMSKFLFEIYVRIS